MLSLLAAAMIAAAPPPQGDEAQVLAGSNFETLVQAVGARCPASRVLYAKPAVLLDAEERFQSGLTGPRKVAFDRLMKADAEIQRCATRDGASCTAGATLGLYRQADLMPDFVTAVCARGDGSWG